MLILLDTNIIVPCLISPRGATAELLDAWIEREFVWLMSPYQFSELERVFTYKHLNDRIRLDERLAFFDMLRSECVFITEFPEVDLSPDPKDNPILASAIAGKADYIVTGNKRDMLELGTAAGIPILTARQMLERLDRA